MERTIKRKSPCPCRSGRTVEQCHLDWDGQLRKQIPSLVPPGAITKFAHPKCYLQQTQNCSEDISREHYVSKAVLDQIGSTLRVIGLPGRGENEALETSAANLTAKILCSRHNEALSPLDQEAAMFFGQLREAQTDIDRRTLSRKPIFHLASGDRRVIRTQDDLVLSTRTRRTDLLREFRKQKRKWVRETQHLSSPIDRYMHPSYVRIIALGPDALGMILRDLKAEQNDWFYALRYIAGVGQDPVTSAMAGDVNRMTAAWVR